MLTGDERESFALHVMEEVRRWPGVEMRPHASAEEPGAEDAAGSVTLTRERGVLL
ncbi:MAG: hypothetical protein ABI969_12670 [bacterium]